MAIDDPLDYGEADSSTRKVCACINAMEGTKQFVHVRHIKTNTKKP